MPIKRSDFRRRNNRIASKSVRREDERAIGEAPALRPCSIRRIGSVRGVVSVMAVDLPGSSPICRQHHFVTLLFGFPVNAQAAGTASHDVKKPARHHHIFVKMNDIRLIAHR